MDSNTFQGLQPILGTGLNVSSRPKVTIGNGDSTMTPADGHLPRKHRASVGKKTTARPSISTKPETVVLDDPDVKFADESQDSLFSQVYEWLQREKAKQQTHYRLQASDSGMDSAVASDGDDDEEEEDIRNPQMSGDHNKRALDRLEKILVGYATTRYESSNASVSSARRSGRRRHGKKGLRRASASESDQYEVEYGVPSVDTFLDNSKTLGYSGGAAEDEQDGDDSMRAKDKEAWATFKTEIVRLAHTMQIKGWRKFPVESACDIDVARLSGALTNAVYVVTPPASLPPPPRAEDGSYTLVARRPPE